MGLDMYLYRRRYVKAWDHQKPEERPEVALKIGGLDVPLVRPSYIEEEVGYWRKANAIHNWFVENCANGVDECQQIHLEREQLVALLDTCKKVLAASNVKEGDNYAGTQYSGGEKTVLTVPGVVVADPTLAAELLPTTAGFFFGCTDYDEGYLTDLQDTIAILEPLVSGEDDFSVDYYYQASW